jgi:hypothetical protein
VNLRQSNISISVLHQVFRRECSHLGEEELLDEKIGKEMEGMLHQNLIHPQ